MLRLKHVINKIYLKGQINLKVEVNIKDTVGV